MMDTIHIDGLKIFAHHGVFEHENINGQNFYVNAVIYTDVEKAALLDELEYSVHYGNVCALIEQVMMQNTYKLIETVAQNIAYSILKEFDFVSEVEIEVRKPEAPIDMDFDSVSVKIKRGWHTAVIALGSNMGDKNAYIYSAIDYFESCAEIKDMKVSSMIVTKPYGYTEQDDFVNGAIIMKTLYSPHKLLDFMYEIENKSGRKREMHWGPRTLDLDLIFYDDIIIADSALNIPHPDMHNRIFVLKPICEIAPWYYHPIKKLTVSQMLKILQNEDDTG